MRGRRGRDDFPAQGIAQGAHVHEFVLNGSVKNPATSIDGQTARYTVTTKQLKYGEALGPIKVGSVVQIDTNGNTVTDISPVN